MPNSLLLIFLDGVGIGPDDLEVNPFLSAQLPTLRELLGGGLPTLATAMDSSHQSVHGTSRLLPLDATLGVEGTPQSGTGQIALLTGHNAPRLFGRHFGPWPPVALRPLLAEENLLVKASQAGLNCAFANAYPKDFLARRETRRVAAPPLAASAAGLLNRNHEGLLNGEAVASEIENEGWRKHLGFTDLPRITPEAAGRNLAGIAATSHLTLYAHYHTDFAGHREGMDGAVAALERVDRFLAGVLEALPDEASLLLVSDHGNIEDVRGGHTRNPALGLLLDRHASPTSPHPRSLTEVTPWVLARLEA